VSAAAARPADVRAGAPRAARPAGGATAAAVADVPADVVTPAAQYVPGIGEPLPPGERLLWAGAPDRAALARRVGHVRGLAVYFAALAVLGGVVASDAAGALRAVATLVGLGATALLFARVFATLVARTSTYAITDRRVVMRVGVAIPAVLNVPLDRIASVDLRTERDGTGDLSVALDGDDRIAYVLLWPHARPWQVKRPQPALRGIADAATVGRILADAVLADADMRERAQRAADAAPAIAAVEVERIAVRAVTRAADAPVGARHEAPPAVAEVA
jgi:hypothetical protein